MPRTVITMLFAALVCATAMQRYAHAGSVYVQFFGGLICDEASQVVEILKHHGSTRMSSIMRSINARTGKNSCGVIRALLVLKAEPVRVVDTPAGQAFVVKLTGPEGFSQFSFRPVARHANAGKSI
ncbi:MAG: hypothetical protein ACR2OX_07485 [Methyloligellaceae bacterium]